MSGLQLDLKAPLATRVDFSGITPALLVRLGAGEASFFSVPCGAGRVALGDLFEVSATEGDALVIAGDPRLDFVGAGLEEGEIRVEGPVGAFAGQGMTGGILSIQGDAGEGLACDLKGGRITVSGAAGARLGGAAPGERTGMREGVVEVKGHAGPHLGERMRGGLILVGGDAGPDAAFGMIAGTVAVAGRLGPGAGQGLKRGTLLLAQEPEPPAAGVVDNGAHDLVALALISRRVPEIAALFGGPLSGRVRRKVGDLLAGGQGEMLILS